MALIGMPLWGAGALAGDTPDIVVIALLEVAVVFALTLGDSMIVLRRVSFWGGGMPEVAVATAAPALALEGDMVGLTIGMAMGVGTVHRI